MIRLTSPQVKVFEFHTTPGNNPLSEALNYGLARARYPVIFRMDADTYLGAKDTIEQAIYPMLSEKAVGTCCNVRINNPQTILEYFLSMEFVVFSVMK